MNRIELENYISETFSTSGEQLFAKHPGYLVFRHRGSRKWFAVIMDIPEKYLDEIEKIAQAMGMVPQSQIPQVEIEVNVPQQESQPTAWESFFAFLTGLFA